jgi:FkbM family methyltransferase
MLRRALRQTAGRLRNRPSPAHRRLARHFAGSDEPVVLTDSNGMRFVLHAWELEQLDELLSKSFYRPDFDAIDRLLAPGDTAVDVGANVGTHSVMMSERVGASGRVIAFEPVATTAWLMRENLALNRVENVDLHVAAVSDGPGRVEMNLFDQRYSAWNSRGSANFDGIVPIETVEVASVSLDDTLASLGVEQVAFLKIDVEGYEIDVLRGAQALLGAGAIACLSFEISDVPLQASGHTAAEVFEFLASHGFACYRYEDGRFTGPFASSDDFYANFYASREDLSAR